MSEVLETSKVEKNEGLPTESGNEGVIEGKSEFREAAKPASTHMKSWTSEDTLRDLADKQRFGDIVSGVIRGLKEMEFPVNTRTGKHLRSTEVLTVALPEGVTGYCPVEEFSEIKYKNHMRFVGRKHNFVIEHLDLANSIALLSGKKADRFGISKFFNQLEEDETNGTVFERDYVATVTGRNDAKKLIYVDVDGQSGHIYQSDWAWERDNAVPDSGTTATVRISKYKKESKEQLVVQFSRKILLPNPFEFVATLKAGEIVAGKVQDIHPIHGVFVELENGVSLKASVARRLDNPKVGEMVTCRVDKIEEREGGGYKGRVTVISYPNGNKRARDLGSFLFNQ